MYKMAKIASLHQQKRDIVIRELNADKEIVYRNTMCRDLYLNDVAGQA